MVDTVHNIRRIRKVFHKNMLTYVLICSLTLEAEYILAIYVHLCQIYKYNVHETDNFKLPIKL
jgi:hypothetical protein